MTQGKTTCKILKELRRRIAEANDIALTIEECRYKGDCPGTCPRCEDEVRYLESQLQQRRSLGYTVILTGLSAGIVGLSSCSTGSKSVATTPASHFESGELSCEVADSTIPESNDRALMGVVEQMPEFPGGEKALKAFITENLTYPDSAVKANIEGTVILNFRVLEDGSIDKNSIKILRSKSELFDDEAIRVVKMLPPFIPGRLYGRKVTTWFTLPIRFSLPKTPVNEPTD